MCKLYTKFLFRLLFTFVIGFFQIFVFAYGGKNEKPKQVNYVLSLSSFNDFKLYQGAPLSDKFNDVLSVKLVYDFNDNTLYFVNSGLYRYHYDFCFDVLGDNTPLDQYNTLNYGNSHGRRYYLANLNYYSQCNRYGLEFSSEDRISGAQIGALFAMLLQKTYLGDSLKLLISSDYLLKLDKEGKLNVPKVYTTDIYNNQKYQMLNHGTTYGILRMAGEDEQNSFSENDIVIMKGTPLNVPVSAGIITNSYQTPLSHINILCHNKNIPSAVDINILSNPDVIANLNKPVKLVVSTMGMAITPADRKSADSMATLHRHRLPVILKANLEVKELLPVKKFDLRQKDIIGNKAAGLGELARIAARTNNRYNVPEGAFAIPFYYYKEHISKPAIRQKLDELDKLALANAPDEVIKKLLKVIRQAIKDEPINQQLLADVTQMIRANGEWKAYRFRSSANAEDIIGFSAAGLYESHTGKPDDADKPIDKAIKKVWASAYTDVAYLERKAANIDERTMMMGILVHRSFPAEVANGVAITGNLYRPHFPGFTVNVQINEVPVVSPPDSVTCEQFICMNSGVVTPQNIEVTTDYITFSNITDGKPVLSREQVKELYNALSTLQEHYNYNLSVPRGEGVDAPPLDIEFKFDNNGKLYFKQVRPYR